MLRQSSGNMASSGRRSFMPIYTAFRGTRQDMISQRDCTTRLSILRKVYVNGTSTKVTTSIWRIDQPRSCSRLKRSATWESSRVYSGEALPQVGAASNGVQHSSAMKKEFPLSGRSWRSGRYSNKEHAMLTKPVSDEYIIAGDLTFHSMKWGERGQPLICVHGITANAYCFQALADGLANDYQVLAYDLRGRGDSDKPESGYSVPIHAAGLAVLID